MSRSPRRPDAYRDRERIRDRERDTGRERERESYHGDRMPHSRGPRTPERYQSSQNLPAQYATSPPRRSDTLESRRRSRERQDSQVRNLDYKTKKDRTVDVCMEFLRGRCNRSELMCRYAHPPRHVTIQDGKVTCCFDYNKGRCNRINPPCRYFHPPPHLMLDGKQDGLYMGVLPPELATAIAAYTSSLQKQYQIQAGGSRPDMGGRALARSAARGGACVMPARDKIEICREFRKGRCTREGCKYAHPPDWMNEDMDNCVRICMDYVNGKCSRDTCRFFHPPGHLLQRIIVQFGYSEQRMSKIIDSIGQADHARGGRDHAKDGGRSERSGDESSHRRRRSSRSSSSAEAQVYHRNTTDKRSRDDEDRRSDQPSSKRLKSSSDGGR